jgi:hypothetical protein
MATLVGGITTLLNRKGQRLGEAPVNPYWPECY